MGQPGIVCYFPARVFRVSRFFPHKFSPDRICLRPLRILGAPARKELIEPSPAPKTEGGTRKNSGDNGQHRPVCPSCVVRIYRMIVSASFPEHIRIILDILVIHYEI